MKETRIAGRTVRIAGDPENCEWLLLQPEDPDEAGMAAEEAECLARFRPEARFALAAFGVDWWQDLTPWPCEPLFRGQPPFGDGAERTLSFVTGELIPGLLSGRARAPRVVLGGYSLAGLFALYAGYASDRFDGIAAASPSVWYPGWTEYADARRFLAKRAYLSLGDREARTRNVLMKTVDEAIRAQYGTLAAQGIPALLEWNPGNHFVDAALRTAKGFAYCIETNGKE